MVSYNCGTQFPIVHSLIYGYPPSKMKYMLPTSSSIMCTPILTYKITPFGVVNILLVPPDNFGALA